jgi:hypothetical protein
LRYSFGSLSDLQSWLVTSKDGRISVLKAVWKNWRSWMSTAVGCRIREQIEDSVLEGNRLPVVVEFNSDGFVRVYGDKRVSVRFVNAIETSSDEAHAVAEEILSLSLRGSHREVYLDERRILGTWTAERVQATDFAAKEFDLSLNGTLDSIARKS